MIINDLDGCYIVFDTKNRNMELDTLPIKSYVLYIFLSPKYTWLFTSLGKFSPPIVHFAASISFILKSGQVIRKEASTTDSIFAGDMLKSS